ncbi:phospholipase D-like domain-containing protein [Marinobacter orientalis]|nr:phospholipase D-like domain-containing protein [Marinobacter orientalis]TGX51455.1 hypothetical protein DIT72_05370 [Marinobacter orientalis]
MAHSFPRGQLSAQKRRKAEMKVSEANRIYLAKDVYRIWKSRVSEAAESITVYTPFFDGLLISLLKNAQLENESITIVTDLDPSSLLGMPKQLQAIKRALSNGINVLSTPRLHAKVLLTDDKLITVGSQNFTSYGRKSKECTAVPAATLIGSNFVDSLIRWRDDATSIDEDFIDTLLAKLLPHIKRHKQLLEGTEAEFVNLLAQHKEKKHKTLLRRLEYLERQSRIRMSNGIVYASIEHIYGEGDDYDSLIADQQYDMTRWVIEKPNGSSEPYLLSRLAMYPMIIAETGRMGFARIGKTRITYIRKSLKWSKRALEVGGYSLGVTINFPATDTKKRNIEVKLTHPYLGACEAAFLFTGDEFRLIRKSYSKGGSQWNDQYKTLVKILDDDFFGAPDSISSFFRKFFTSFTYKELGIDNKNVRDFLTGTRFRLSVIQYQENPVLVIKTQS